MQSLPTLEAVNLSQLSNGLKSQFDSLVVVFPPETFESGEKAAGNADMHTLLQDLGLTTLLAEWNKGDKAFAKDCQFMPLSALTPTQLSTAGFRALVTSPTGTLDRDGDDVRRYSDAVCKAIKRLRQAGPLLRRPLLVIAAPSQIGSVDPLQDYSRVTEVCALAALAETYDSLHVRESSEASTHCQIEGIGMALVGGNVPSNLETDAALNFARAVEEGRRLARDVGASDPERMAAPRAATYIHEYFNVNAQGIVECTVLSDPETLSREYPCLMAVARASMPIARHQPRVVHLSYRSPDQSAVEEELHFIGKGVTYDTGGADLKVGGNMVGMSRDKCGAAAVSGFLATVARLRPKHLNISARLAFVRNSIGADAYVSDEIITSRAGVRVRIGNTDAEGRMAMCDLIAQAREEVIAGGAESLERARVFTIATLTGHAARTYGPYTAALDNTAARRRGIAPRLFAASQAIADPFELSTLRREDFKIIAPVDPAEDVLQANRHPSVATSRGHQYPMAFMITAAGLTAPKKDSDPDASKIAYTHLDIAGSAEESGVGSLGRPTGAPIPTLSATFLLQRLAKKLI